VLNQPMSWWEGVHFSDATARFPRSGLAAPQPPISSDLAAMGCQVRLIGLTVGPGGRPPRPLPWSWVRGVRAVLPGPSMRYGGDLFGRRLQQRPARPACWGASPPLGRLGPAGAIGARGWTARRTG